MSKSFHELSVQLVRIDVIGTFWQAMMRELCDKTWIATCEVVHETNKAHFKNLLPNRFLHSSVGKALAWKSRGSCFNSHWGQFLTKFIYSSLCKDLLDNLTETPIVKNSNLLTYFHFHFHIQNKLPNTDVQLFTINKTLLALPRTWCKWKHCEILP